MPRPPKYDETMTRKSITVTQAQAAWMDAQENASEIIRDYINERMNKMNPKTKELIETHAATINRIKELNTRIAEASERIKARERDGEMLGGKFYEDWHNLNMERDVTAERLREAVEDAYFDVPFSKPRKQGIENFYRAAGL